MNLKGMQLAVIVATIATIAINVGAELIPLNGKTVGQISDQFHVLFVPAGYVFAIWGLIYIGMIAYAVGQIWLSNKKHSYIEKISPWYILSAIANCAWIYFWHYEYFFTTGVIMVVLLLSLLAIYGILVQNPAKTTLERLTLHLPFRIYAGWISVATIANFSAILSLTTWDKFGLSDSVWAGLLILVACTIAGYLLASYLDIAFTAVIIWAVVGILIKSPTHTAIMLAGVLGITSLLVMGIYKLRTPTPKTTKKLKR